MDYKETAKRLIELLGGKENIISAAHCATRLRLVMKDESKIDQAQVEELDGVKGLSAALASTRSFSEQAL